MATRLGESGNSRLLEDGTSLRLLEPLTVDTQPYLLHAGAPFIAWEPGSPLIAWTALAPALGWQADAPIA